MISGAFNSSNLFNLLFLLITLLYKSFRSEAKSIWHYKSTEYSLTGAETNLAVRGCADIVLESDKAEIKDPSFNKLVFPVGQKGVKAVNASGAYTFRRRQTGTAAANATLVYTHITRVNKTDRNTEPN